MSPFLHPPGFWVVCVTLSSLKGHPPVAVETIQLFLHLAAQAPPVLPVQPLPHYAQAVLTLVLIEGKVLYSGRNTASALKGGAYRCSWSSADILAEHKDIGEKKKKKRETERDIHR